MLHRLRVSRISKRRRTAGWLELLEQRLLFATDWGCASESLNRDLVNAESSVALYAMANPISSEQQRDSSKLVGPSIDSHQLKHRDLPDGTILDSQGLAYAKRPAFELGMPNDTGNGGLGGDGPGSSDPPVNSGPIVPIFHSKPNAPKKIYLDFDGEMVSGTFWNNQTYFGTYNTGSVINAPAFSIDGDRSTFSAQELTVIREVWARMAEDFAPFQVDVTTEYPGDEVIYAGREAIRVMISTDTDATTNQQWFPTAGGVAYLNSWTYTNGTPVWVFYNRLGTSNAKNIAEAGSHEVGHAFGLFHDGRTSPAEGYYWGHGSGQTGWAPIMGVGYNRALVQWSQGDYLNANQKQDDLAIISSYVPYEPDDHGDTRQLATPLLVDSQGGVSASGLIATRGDKDAFQFFTQTGQVTLRVDPFELSTGKANLDAELTILDSQGNLVASVNPPLMLDASATLSLTKGTYTAIVDGVGKAATTGDQGYTDYGSLGWYTISGSVVRNRAPLIDLVNSSVVAFEGDSLTNGGTWSDPNPNDLVTITASIGTVEQLANGNWQWSLSTQDQFAETEVTITATDDLGAATTVSFLASALNRAPAITVSSSSVNGPVLSMLTNAGTWSDVASDTVTLAASIGSIDRREDGTWTWQYQPLESASGLTVVVSAADEDGGSFQVQFTLNAIVAIVDSSVYHKGSSFANTSVDAAMDTSKVLAKSGATSQKLSFANLINTSRGINGLVFDVAGLAAASLTAADFTFRMSPTGNFNEVANPPSRWGAAPEPTLIHVTPGTASTAARVRLEWQDNAIANRWLQVKVLDNSNTGLVEPHVYYIGHLLGETDGSETNFTFLVQNSDILLVRSSVGTLAPVFSVADLDKNGLHQNADIGVMRSRVGIGALRIITIPAAGSDGEGESVRIGASPLAPPEVEHAKVGISFDEPTFGWNRIAARLTNKIFDVPLPTMMMSYVADTSAAPRISGPGGGDAVQEDSLLLLSLDQYFERIGQDLR